MAFNADEYIGVIVEQIGGNFQELHKAVGDCDKFLKAQEAYLKQDMNNGNPDEFVKLFDEVNLYKKNIDDLICNYEDYSVIEPLSVGLFGEWGSGKTHLLKLIQSQIITKQQEEKYFEKKDKQFPQTTIPIFFNAWRFEKEEHLIVPLFQTLIASIEAFDSNNLDDLVRKQLGRTKERLKLFAFALANGLQVPTNWKLTALNLLKGEVGALLDFVDTDKLKEEFEKSSKEAFITKENIEELLKSDRIESVYMNIPQWIEKISIADNINFVFLIDDLDRCLPENTLKMLESIKLFLDVPSCAFVLAIDDDVVERGVEHHYRDYLKDMVRHELPITGHEYLEKMIQLPFRIPVIGEEDVLKFLRDNYKKQFDELFKERIEFQRNLNRDIIIDEADLIMKFFAETIPSKPRKIKRTAMLFQTKVKVLQTLNQHVDHFVVAKLTLLELFAPKLLRFIQNNNYKEMFDVLHDFSNLPYDEKDELTNSLENSLRIKKEIAKYQNEGDKRIYSKLMEIVEENYHSRMVFKLDYIFKVRLEKAVLIEAMEQKARVVIAEEEKEVINLMSKEFEALLFGKTETQWRKAFDDHELFEEGKALLTRIDMEKITKKVMSKKYKDNKSFRHNAKWLLIIAEYITQGQFVKFLKDIYPYEMNKYQTTFEEYEVYCKEKNIDVPNDEAWGRGKRPVINVSWEDATFYAGWLSNKKTKEEGKKVKYRLPTEDEWYLACNVGAKTTWYFENDVININEYAWNGGNSKGKTHPVGELKPNKLGLYDMHGNVWEWCSTWYDKEKDSKVLKGGSWYGDSFYTRSSNRYWKNPKDSVNVIGFRLLRVLP